MAQFAPIAAAANVDLKVRLGWGDVLRPDRWMPVIVTASAPGVTATRPLSVRIDIESLQSGANVMQIHQFATIGPDPVTYTLYIPFHFSGPGSLGVTLRDADTQRTLARWPTSPADEPIWNRIPDPRDRLIGVAGEAAALDAMIDGSAERVRVAQIGLDQLPQQPIGYDSLDLLVLNRANLNNISQDQQQAIARWVRSGGALLMWPSDIPASPGPLLDLLPCRVGVPQDYPLSPAVRSAAGLGEAFAVLHGSELRPAADATAIPLLPDANGKSEVTAYMRRAGFGRVLVAPFDVSRLVFDSPAAGQRFYQKLTGPLLLHPPVDIGSSQDWVSLRQEGALAAFERTIAAAAPPPQTGPFADTSWLWMFLGLGVICGPIDWLGLRLLGQRSVNWVTVGGWLALVVSGAMLIVQTVRPSPLKVDSLTVIDQADDHVVATTTLAGIISAKPATEHFPDSPGSPGWWQPVAGDASAGRGLRFDSRFHQSADANAPESTAIAAGKPRLLHGEASGPAAAMVKADLRLAGSGDRRRLSGSITNLSSQALLDVRVRFGSNFAAPVGTIAGGVPPGQRASASNDAPIVAAKIDPGQTVAIDADVAAPDSAAANTPATQAPRGAVVPSSDAPAWMLAGDLAAGRSLRIDQELAAADASAALIVAKVSDFPSPITLESSSAPSSGTTLLRALVRLNAK